MAVSFVALIPARMASSRLPGKPLADLGGIPMVVRVAHRAQASGARRVVIATDSPAVAQAGAAHGIETVMTDAAHVSGTDRLAQAAALLGLADEEIVVNVQGDEPLIEPALIDACAAALEADGGCVMSTAAHPIESVEDWLSPNIVKVVLDARHRALYFSRSPLPAWRDRRDGQPLNEAPSPVMRHVGLYAYRAGFLRRYAHLKVSPVEQAEMLEQLRVLWNGLAISVHVTDHAPAPGVDTPQDLERVRRLFAANPQLR